MDKHLKAVCLAKSETLSGWADTLRSALSQALPNYKDLRNRIEAIIQGMEERAKEWKDATHNHLDRN